MRTYIKCKNEYTAEPYVKLSMAPKYRSALAKLRCGILPLEIETGRYVGTDECRRFCKLCLSGEVENEYHLVYFYDG